MSDNNTVPPVAEAIQAKEEEVGFKVFVGNLSFATKEEELKELFGKHGQLNKAQIIHRGPRSLGYGFVTFNDESAATAAISALDKNEINGRTINVEMAKPPEKLKQLGEEVAEKVAEGAERGEKTRGRGRGRGRGRSTRGRARRPGPRADGEKDEEAADGEAKPVVNGDAAATGEEGEKKKSKPKKKKAKKPKVEGEKSDDAADGEAKPKPVRQRREKGPPTGEPSTTGLFIANLPFNIDDAGLTAIFTGATPPFEVVSSKIVLRRGGRANGKSKGFGFVDLKDEEQQKRALTQLDGATVGERPIQIKIAVNQEEKKEDQINAELDGIKKEETDKAAEPTATIVAS